MVMNLPQVDMRVNGPGISLTLKWNEGVFSKFESHVIPYPLDIRPDSLAQN